MHSQAPAPRRRDVGQDGRIPWVMPAPDGFPAYLAAKGHVGPGTLIRISSLGGKGSREQSRQGWPRGGRQDMAIGDLLLLHQMITAETLTDARADFFRLTRIDPLEEAPDPRLIDTLGSVVCLSMRVLPWRRIGGVTLVAISAPENISRVDKLLQERFGEWLPVLAEDAAIRKALALSRGQMMRRHAETRLPGNMSCRTWRQRPLGTWLPLAVLGLGAVIVAAPLVLVTVLLIWSTISLLATLALKGAALIASVRPAVADTQPNLIVAQLPVVSIIVPLYRETDIAPRLLQRLGRIDYPRDLLQIVLAVEEGDTGTRNALAEPKLPRWMQIVVVPDGPLKTKPRALNYALAFCRGSIIGIYDAEDAPQPDQIARVVQRFHERGDSVGCLQGVLDYYNPNTNWLARCFTVEYAAWFRVVMPGLERLGLPMPLGGTTLFVRRTALEEVGAWDAHNVTEDADLGIRLARHGYRTEMIDTVTGEEANCRLSPWVRQRSRWIKGHMLTWAVHMRNPRQLWRDLGPRGFIGYQALFLGAQSQFLLAPFLWSFWIVAFGFSHPVHAIIPATMVIGLMGLFMLAEVLNIAIGIVGARRTAHQGLWPWAVTLHFYYPLAGFAAWRAFIELFRAPFYWAKTSHGHFDGGSDAAPQSSASAPSCGTFRQT